MRPISIVIVVVALILAGLVYYAVPQLMNRGEQLAPAPQPAKIAAAEVMVAAKVLPAGTILKADDVRWQAWPADALDPSFLVKSKGADAQKDAVGHVVLHGFEVGEPITAQRLIKAGQVGFLAAALKPGFFAVSVSVTAVSGTSGFIQPGDRVDVLLYERFAIQPPPEAAPEAGRPKPPTIPFPFNEEHVGNVILQNLRVLAVDQAMQDIDSKPKVASTATLEVTLEQAEKLAAATGMGSLSLTLRSLTAKAEEGPPAPKAPDFVTDIQISPYRASRYNLYLAKVADLKKGESESARPAAPRSSGGGEVRVYHGAAAAGGQAK